LLKLGAVSSPHVESLSDHFRQRDYAVEQVRVPYEFQRNANRILKIRKMKYRGRRI
jgi:hypothetical protein